LLNLLIMLLVQRHYVSKERIRAILYPDSRPDAFEKMFERDKEELRSLGVPIEVGSIDPLFDDEPGYRISPDQFALPDVRLTADEAAVVGLATRVWEHARLADATTDAVRKLTAAGVEVDVSALDLVEPRLSADEPAFDVFWDATQARQEVEFDYQRPGFEKPSRRHLQPWGVVRHAGRWYVLGLDTDRNEERVFRLSRVVGEATRVGAPGAYEIPDGVDLRETTRRLAPTQVVVEATLLLRKGAGATLRRAASSVANDVPGPDSDSPWDRVVVRADRLADDLLALGPDVVVEAPEGLREELLARLRATVGAA
jgi:proteasome accessory factor B